MTTLPLFPLASAAAIRTAFRNAARDEAQYTVDLGHTPGFVWVTHTTDRRRRYLAVQIEGGAMTCDCPQYCETAACKHCVMAADELAYFADLEARADNYDPHGCEPSAERLIAMGR
jgi:hypothetical protein